MSKRLEGRVAVITGAGSGIGYATAIRLAAEGAKVVVADTNEESGNKVAKEVGGLFVKCDVYALPTIVDYALDIGHLHLVVLLHVTHSSDKPPSPPVHIDLPPLPGQLLASSKVFPCCKQYLQRLQRTVPTLSFPL
jgi:shikimate 5-dehydrogenase